MVGGKPNQSKTTPRESRSIVTLSLPSTTESSKGRTTISALSAPGWMSTNPGSET
jgi:hypothetical protein